MTSFVFGSLSATMMIPLAPLNHSIQCSGKRYPHFITPPTLHVAAHPQTSSAVSTSFSPSTIITVFPAFDAATTRGSRNGTRAMPFFESPNPHPNFASGSGVLRMNVFFPSSCT